MKRVSLLFVLFCATFQLLWAQSGYKNIEITVLSENKYGKRQPMANVRVFGFYDMKKANTFWAGFKDHGQAYADDPTHYDVADITPSDGMVTMKLPPGRGYLVIIPPLSDPIKRMLPNKTSVPVIIKEGDDGTTMKEATVTEKKKRKNTPANAIRVGNMKRVPVKYLIFPEDTRDDARFGMAPIIKEIESGDTFQRVRPFIKDGLKYKVTQNRRMGFDPLRNDPLARFAAAEPMKTRTEDSICSQLIVWPMKKGHHYQVDATEWFENFTTVYKKDSICLDEGFDIEPMRFLEFNVEEMGIDIDTTRYEMKGKREASKDSALFNIKFVVGKSFIAADDSASWAELGKMKRNIFGYQNDADGSVEFITITGGASPDGNLEKNIQLSRERANYIADELKRSFPELRSVIYVQPAQVATWDDVANQLEADSMAAEAASLRSLIQTYPKAVVDRKVKELPFYSYIDEHILKTQRAAKFACGYVVNRIRSNEEIYKLYDTRPEYQDGTAEKPYEFYKLFQRFAKDPVKLEKLAKAAYERVRENEVRHRPWPLAAYYLAKCKLRRNEIDTTLLKPYLDWNYSRAINPRNFEQQLMGWMNDEAIVMCHIAHLCKADNFLMADSIARNLLNKDDPRFTKLFMFLECLNMGWNDPAVREAVKETSHLNHLVVYAAQSYDFAEDRTDSPTDYHKEAFNLARDTAFIRQDDDRVQYLTAILAFKLCANVNLKRFEGKNFIYIRPVQDDYDDEFDSPTGAPNYDLMEEEDDKMENWGYPMIAACQLNPFHAKYMQTDGYFNKAYRDEFNFFWKGLADGKKLFELRKEWDELPKKENGQTTTTPSSVEVPGNAPAPEAEVSESGSEATSIEDNEDFDL